MNLVRYCILLCLKAISRLFYRHDVRWLAGQPPTSWSDLRLIAILHHTSLYEWLYAGSVPNRLLWRIASRGLVPAAEKTISRPLLGMFLKSLAPRFVSITREPDHTWDAVLGQIGADSLVIILPEGRMMRADGLDKRGKPMTVRGGIADILRAIPAGKMLLAYSGGLHHVQIPGQTLPRLFKRLQLTLEIIDIESYKEQHGAQRAKRFKRYVKDDLEARRKVHSYGRENDAARTAS